MSWRYRVLPEEELISAVLTIIRQQAAVIIGNGYRLKRSGSDLEQKAAMEKEIVRLQQEAEHDRKYLISLYEHFVSGVLSRTEYTRPLAKLSKAIKVADTSKQGKAESKTLSPVAVTLREDTKSFDKTDGVFNKDTFS